MSDGPYDFARERWEAEAEAIGGTRRINGDLYDENDVPDMTDQLALDLEPLNLEPIAPGLTIQERFEEFDRRNPWVYTALVKADPPNLARAGRSASASGCCWRPSLGLRHADDAVTLGA
jgi:hypothetical protein